MKQVNLFSHMNKRRSFGCLLFFILLAACSPPHKKKQPVSTVYLKQAFQRITAARVLIKDGDIIFRNGTDDVSEAARSMNRADTSYSHCGLLFVEHDSVVVYHALGGSYNPGMKLMREPLDSFCNPRDNDAFGIYRYELTPGQEQLLANTVHRHYANGLKFDMYFNYDSDDQMYCSEFVFKSLNTSLNGRLTPYVRLDTMPYGVTTDDIFLNPACKLVKKEKFIP